jgi:pyruvate ferredoxin oxidoreductase beta subunit
MTAIAVAHHIPYVAQAASSHWQDLSEKIVRAAHAGGPAFLNVLTSCRLGWGHEPRLSPWIVNAAVDTRFWPLYEVVDGRYRLTYVPEAIVPVEDWLRPQKRFAHLFTADGLPAVREIERRVAREWDELLERCGP